MKRICLNSNDGFTLVESLLAFGISIIVISSLSIFGTLKLSLQGKYIDNSLNVAIYQLADTLVTARNISYGTTLEFEDSQGDVNQIFLDEDVLVRTPGYVIYTKNISRIEFYLQDNLIYLELEKQGKIHTFLVGSDYQNEVESDETAIIQ